MEELEDKEERLEVVADGVGRDYGYNIYKYSNYGNRGWGGGGA